MKFFQRTFKFLRDTFTGDKLAIGIDAASATDTLDVNGNMRVRLMNDGTGISSIAVVDPDGKIYKQNLINMLPENLFLYSASYDAPTNILTLTLNNGTSFPVNLTDLVDLGTITKLVDSNGDSKVEVERLVDEDIIWVTVENGDVMKVEATQSSFLKNAAMKNGYAMTKTEVTIDGYQILSTDHLIHVIGAIPEEVFLPDHTSIPHGKIIEISLEQCPTLEVAATGATINGNAGPLEIDNQGKGESYKRFILDKSNANWICVEELERHGFLYDGVSSVGTTTITDTGFSGFKTSDVQVYRDGSLESNTAYTLANGVLTVTDPFGGENVQVRLI